MTILLTVLAMLAFAANSLLARAALDGAAIDAASYTAIRLVSGALALMLLIYWQRGRDAFHAVPGNWPSAVALFSYALAFSLAYLRLGAATGALILFASVQGTMISWGIVKRNRPTGLELTGLVLAFAAFVYLLAPGLNAPDPYGSMLMVASGIAWGVYSLRGRGSATPLGDTAGNFVRSALICLPLSLLPMFAHHITPHGVGLAAASGVLASGLGYAIWYRALPGLSTTQAAVVQLTVPVIAASGATSMLGESLSTRLVLSSLCILCGVGLAILSRRPK
ncbi:DMT family transporter [Aminobacter sp. AP02]|uniref:DMT family transporter n=1 Tax=Aminobacter sp. AP02 TaxID=2135737 RepID=UPI000D7A8A26|nr:DMT family transporter [Aminobacter sp. AP02]PWK70559.1 threonine/homoserine efflux transporter RhtA [Aminobacter sp. AP02]